MIVRDPFDSDFNFEEAAEFKIELPAMTSFPNAVWQFGVKLEPPQNLSSSSSNLESTMTSKIGRESETAEIMMHLSEYQSKSIESHRDPNKQEIKPSATNQGPSQANQNNDQQVSSTTQSANSPMREEFYFALKHQTNQHGPQKIANPDFLMQNILPKQESNELKVNSCDSMPKLEPVRHIIEPGLTCPSKSEIHNPQQKEEQNENTHQDNLQTSEQESNLNRKLAEPCWDQILEEKFKSENLHRLLKSTEVKEEREPLVQLDINQNVEAIRRNDREAPPPCNCFPDSRCKFNPKQKKYDLF